MVAIMATTTTTERKKMKGDDRLIIAIILDIIAITFVFKIHKKLMQFWSSICGLQHPLETHIWLYKKTAASDYNISQPADIVLPSTVTEGRNSNFRTRFKKLIRAKLNSRFLASHWPIQLTTTGQLQDTEWNVSGYRIRWTTSKHDRKKNHQNLHFYSRSKSIWTELVLKLSALCLTRLIKGAQSLSGTIEM